MKPVLQALVLAEKVYEDKSGKKIIVGTFNSLSISKKEEPEAGLDANGKNFVKVRGDHPGSPYAYISLTDVCNNTELQLQFVSLTRNQVLFEKSIKIHCDDRLATIELPLPLPHLPISEAGVYAFEVVCEGEIIGSMRLRAIQKDDQKGEEK